MGHVTEASCHSPRRNPLLQEAPPEVTLPDPAEVNEQETEPRPLTEAEKRVQAHRAEAHERMQSQRAYRKRSLLLEHAHGLPIRTPRPPAEVSRALAKAAKKQRRAKARQAG